MLFRKTNVVILRKIKQKMNKRLLYIFIISFLTRLLLAFGIELGNDEVYYRIFALFLDWSYFDHPPMVAWLIRLTTLGANVAPDGFVRLGAVIIGAINTLLIYRITKNVCNSEKAGLISALLYNGSIYCFIISGTFIMPDTPLTLFWLLALERLITILPCKEIEANQRRSMLLASFYIGLAMLSKYTGAYLWGAAGLYILLYNRQWLKEWSIYIGFIVSILIFTPVIYWNIENDFITFTFHGARVTAQNSIKWLYFGREIFGSIFYNNPINWVLALVAILSFKRGKSAANTDIVAEGNYISRDSYRMLVIFSLPMILLFLSISLTRETLPHWAAPAYLSLIILTSAYLVNRRNALKLSVASMVFTLVVCLFGLIQINYGVLDLDSRTGINDLGRKDFSLDTYGWRQGGEKFAELVAKDKEQGIVGEDGELFTMPDSTTIIHYSWSYAAHLDCYFAIPYGFTTKTIGKIESTHYWEWINKKRGGFAKGDSLYLVTSSRRKMLEPTEIYKDKFNTIMPADTIKIYRDKRHEYNFYVYRMLGYR